MLRETIKELREKGFNAIETQNVAPDGIVVINGKIIAIEILSTGNKSAIIEKRTNYSMFDDIIFRTFDRKPIELDEIQKVERQMEKKANDIVDDFIKEMQIKQEKTQKIYDTLDSMLGKGGG